jgi:hypothetical protein
LEIIASDEAGKWRKPGVTMNRHRDMNAWGDMSGHDWGERRAGFTRAGTSADERLFRQAGRHERGERKKERRIWIGESDGNPM